MRVLYSDVTAIWRSVMPNFLQVLSATVLALSLITPTFADDEVFEINNPLGFATSITNANNGDLLLMRGNRLVRSSDGRTLSEPVEMSIGVHGVTRLDDEHLIARSRHTFYVSTDDGATWQHYRTIDRTVLAPAGRVEPEREPGMARAIEFVGEIPGDWGHLDYPNIGFVGDRVIVSWNNTVSGPRLLVAPAS